MYKERNPALEKTERKESFFEQMRSTKRAQKPFDVLQSFRSKLNEFNFTSRGERKGFALEKVLNLSALNCCKWSVAS